MKYLTTLLFLVTINAPGVYAQSSSGQNEWSRENQESVNIAAKLFPDLTRQGTQLLRQYSSISAQMRWCSTVDKDSYEPLFVAALAGQSMGIEPNWAALSDDEKFKAFQQITYLSNQVTLLMAAQHRQITSSQQVTAGDSSFNPEAVEGPARQAFAPRQQSQTQSYQATDAQTGQSSIIYVTPGD